MNQKIQLSSLKRFFNLLRVDRQEIISIYVYAIFSGLLSLSLPLGIQAIINLISGGQVSTSWVILMVLVIVGIALNGVMQIMQLTISENLQQKIFTKSAFEFAFRIPRMKLEAVDKTYMPEIVNRFFDTLSVQKGLSKILIDFSTATLQVVFGLILLSLYHPFFIALSALLIAIVYLIFKITAPKGLKTSLVESKRKYEVAHWLEELARTIETFKMAGQSSLPLKRTDELVEGYLFSRKAHFKTLLVQYINMVGFKVIIAAGLLSIGGMLVINQQMNIGQFVASEIIIILVLASVEKLILSMENIYDVLTAIEKIGSVTDIPLERDTGAKVSDQKEENFSVHLNNLTYQFSGAKEESLKNIHLQIAAGEKVCVAGYNGSGKTLLLQTMAGFYDDYSGALTYNDIPLGNWCKEDLRSLMGDGLSKENIFKGSLLENITLGKPQVSIQEVQKISRIVGLTGFIETLIEGYSTELISEGMNLPSNIRLKIMLARSLAGERRLLLLEDNFNQLNKVDKTRFLDYVLTCKSTVVAISNDPQIAARFNRVAVLEEGRLLEAAPIAQLEKREWYSNVFQN